MSKKQLQTLHSQRLDNLFADLGRETSDLPFTESQTPSGWSWECDSFGRYTSCSPEAGKILGVDPLECIGQLLLEYRLTSESSLALKSALELNTFPIELNVQYEAQDGKLIPVVISILSAGPSAGGNGNQPSVRGYTRTMTNQRDRTEAVVIQPEPPIILPPTLPRVQPEIQQAEAEPLIPIPESLPIVQEDTQLPGIQVEPDLPLSEASPLAQEDIQLAEVEPESPIILSEAPPPTLEVAQVAEAGTEPEPAIFVPETPPAIPADVQSAEVESEVPVSISEPPLPVIADVKPAEVETELPVSISDFQQVVEAGVQEAEIEPEAPVLFEERPLVQENVPLVEAGPEPAIVQIEPLPLVEEDLPPAVTELEQPDLAIAPIPPVQEAKHPVKTRPIPRKAPPSTVAKEETAEGFTVAEASKLLEMLDTNPDHPWSEDEQLLIAQVAGQLTLTLENARLFQDNVNLLDETRQRNEELTTLNKIISTASRSLEMTDMLHEILLQLLNIIDMEAGLVSLVDPATEKLYLAVHHNLPETLLNRLITKGLEGTLCHYVYRRGEVLNISNFHEGAPVDVSGLITMGLSSYLGIPLESRGNILGTVCVFGEHPRAKELTNLALMKTIGQQIGVAVENASLFHQTQAALAETRRQTTNLAVLNDMARALTSSFSVEAVLENILKFTSQLVDTTNFYIGLYEQDSNTVSFPLAIEAGERLEISERTLKNSLTDYVIRTRQPLLVNENIEQRMKELGIDSVIVGQPTQSWLGIPMTIGNQVIGMMAVQDPQPHKYSERDRDLLTAVARQAAIAFQNVRLLEETLRRADQLQTAAEIARESTATLALDTLLDRAVHLIQEGFHYYHASIFLLDEKREKAVVRASTGEAGAEMKRIGHFLAVGSKSIIGYVTHSGQPLVINDVSQDPVHRPNPLLPQTQAETGIPLKIGQKVIGALDVQASELNGFTPDDISVLQILADQLAIAVENARSYELSLNAMDEMRKADQLKSQFLANMSHELRTPLNSIIGFSRVILKGIDGPITDLQQQDLTAIYNSGQHLLNLINDILDLSKIEAGKMELNFEDNVNVTDLINSVMSTVTGLVKDKPIRLVRDIANDLPALRADPLKVRQVMLNLLSNAAKFTEQGTITIRAGSQIGPAGQTEVMISVIDTGPGISLDDRKKLFQPFSQVDASATRKTGGSGLGLSISRHLVEMHGGRIGIDSEVGKGSTFYFTVPVTIKGKPKTGELKPISSSQPLVLAIDNERPILQLYERYLKNHGYQIYGLTDPTKSVEVARKLRPYAITLDVMMPGCDGWQVLEDLKTNQETKNIPVLICTILENQGKADGLGAAEYLTKPILEDDLIQALRRLNKDASRPKS